LGVTRLGDMSADDLRECRQQDERHRKRQPQQYSARAVRARAGPDERIWMSSGRFHRAMMLASSSDRHRRGAANGVGK
jgi:hypothetical protein